MSSNIRIKKICSECNTPFIARQNRTRFCSLLCSQRGYKKQIRDEKIADTSETVKTQNIRIHPAENSAQAIEKALIGMKELSMFIGLSERTLFRLITDPEFPRLKIGKRLLFQKEKVMEYINKKYGTP